MTSEYRDHWHITPTGPSFPSTQTDDGHHHGKSNQYGEPHGDFATHIHKTGCGPTGAPIFSNVKTTGDNQ